MKQLLFSIMVGSILLTGCSENSDDIQESQNTTSTTEVTETTEGTMEESSSNEAESTDNQTEKSTEEQEAPEEVNQGVDEEDMAPASNEEIENSESVSEFGNYEELSYQDFFNPEEYEAHLITDNPGTRVFIFHDGEQQAYKTVFIKNDNRLKVIDIDNNELLMNERMN